MEINGKTRVIPLLAYPSSHVKTPQLFNQRCKERGVNAVAVPWEVKSEHLRQAVASLRAISTVSGMIVTIPHKEAIVNYCDVLEGVAGDLQVANIVRKDENGRLVGAVTDGVGFVSGLTKKGIEVRNARVLLLGAGGAATAIADAIADQNPAELVVANRTADRAVRLVNLIKKRHPKIDCRIGGSDANNADIVINGTSVGLAGDPSIPLDKNTLRPGSVVAEVIMQPIMTPLLIAACGVSAQIHEGHHMLEAQIDGFIDFLVQ